MSTLFRLRKREMVPLCIALLCGIVLGVHIIRDTGRVRRMRARTARLYQRELLRAHALSSAYVPCGGSQAARITNTVRYYAYMYAVDANELLALSMTESHHNARVVSHAGARGLFQFMPYTFRWVSARMGIVNADPYDIEHATLGAVFYWRYIAAYLTERIGRPPTLQEKCYAYNYGHVGATLLIQRDAIDALPAETTGHARRTLAYYNELRRAR